MSRRKSKRTNADYRASADELARFVPSLKFSKRKKEFTRAEKWRVSYWQKRLRYMPNLIPLTKSQMKKMKGQTISPLVQAIQLSNVGKVEKIRFVNKEMFVGANHRTFLFWRTKDLSEYGMQKIAKRTFDQQYPLEQIARLAELAFEKPTTKAIYLWSDHGNVGEPFLDIKAFVEWLLTDYSKYKNVHRWVNGIAILLHDVLSPEESRKVLLQERREARKRKRKKQGELAKHKQKNRKAKRRK